MSWAEVKAINSDFTKPLNEFLFEHKRLVADDGIIKILLNNEDVRASELNVSFVPALDGQVRFCVIKSYQAAHVVVTERETQTELLDETLLGGDEGANYFDVLVKKGLTYDITFPNSSQTNIRYIGVGADVIDETIIE